MKHHQNHLHAYKAHAWNTTRIICMQNAHAAVWYRALSHVKHSAAGLLHLLGLKFRSKLSSGQCNSGQSVKDCLDDRVLVTAFYQICYDVQTDEESKESVLEGVLKIFKKNQNSQQMQIFHGRVQKQKTCFQNTKKPPNESEKIWRKQQSKPNMTSSQQILTLFIH